MRIVYKEILFLFNSFFFDKKKIFLFKTSKHK